MSIYGLNGRGAHGAVAAQLVDAERTRCFDGRRLGYRRASAAFCHAAQGRGFESRPLWSVKASRICLERSQRHERSLCMARGAVSRVRGGARRSLPLVAMGPSAAHPPPLCPAFMSLAAGGRVPA